MSKEKEKPKSLKRYTQCPKCGATGLMTRYIESGRRETRTREYLGQRCDDCGWAEGNLK